MGGIFYLSLPITSSPTSIPHLFLGKLTVHSGRPSIFARPELVQPVSQRKHVNLGGELDSFVNSERNHLWMSVPSPECLALDRELKPFSWVAQNQWPTTFDTLSLHHFFQPHSLCSSPPIHQNLCLFWTNIKLGAQSYFYFFFHKVTFKIYCYVFIWLYPILVAACRISSLTRTEPQLPPLGAWSLSHWATKKVKSLTLSY